MLHILILPLASTICVPVIQEINLLQDGELSSSGMQWWSFRDIYEGIRSRACGVV
jgi:hypothetical protein